MIKENNTQIFNSSYALSENNSFLRSFLINKIYIIRDAFFKLWNQKKIKRKKEEDKDDDEDEEKV